jgi:uncharacterized membrane protein
LKSFERKPESKGKHMWHLLRVYLIIIPVFFLIDFSWLSFAAVKLYKSELGTLARSAGGRLAPIRWAAIIVYLLIPLGIVVFALPKVSTANVFPGAFLWGALYGLVLYGVYDMTNYAMLDKWPLRLTFVDMGWGCLLCGVVGQIAGFIHGSLQ